MRSAAPWLAALLVVAACGSGPRDTSSSPAKPCTGTQVHVSLGESEGATGHGLTRIVATNTSATTCTLAGYPTLRGTNHKGAPADIPVKHGTFFDDPESEKRPAIIAKGERATVNLEASWGCGTGAPNPRYDFSRVTLVLPDGTEQSVEGNFASACMPRIGPWHTEVDPDNQ